MSMIGLTNFLMLLWSYLYSECSDNASIYIIVLLRSLAVCPLCYGDYMSISTVCLYLVQNILQCSVALRMDRSCCCAMSLRTKVTILTIPSIFDVPKYYLASRPTWQPAVTDEFIG